MELLDCIVKVLCGVVLFIWGMEWREDFKINQYKFKPLARRVIWILIYIQLTCSAFYPVIDIANYLVNR